MHYINFNMSTGVTLKKNCIIYTLIVTIYIRKQKIALSVTDNLSVCKLLLATLSITLADICALESSFVAFAVSSTAFLAPTSEEFPTGISSLR